MWDLRTGGLRKLTAELMKARLDVVAIQKSGYDKACAEHALLWLQSAYCTQAAIGTFDKCGYLQGPVLTREFCKFASCLHSFFQPYNHRRYIYFLQLSSPAHRFTGEVMDSPQKWPPSQFLIFGFYISDVWIFFSQFFFTKLEKDTLTLVKRCQENVKIWWKSGKNAWSKNENNEMNCGECEFITSSVKRWASEISCKER